MSAWLRADFARSIVSSRLYFVLKVPITQGGRLT